MHSFSYTNSANAHMYTEEKQLHKQWFIATCQNDVTNIAVIMWYVLYKSTILGITAGQ